MVTIRYLQVDGSVDELDVAIGTTVRDAALEEGVPGIEGECGGQMNCATCHVYVDDAWLPGLPAIEELEDAMLDAAACPRDGRSRLSCQLPVDAGWNGFTVHVPEAQY